MSATLESAEARQAVVQPLLSRSEQHWLGMRLTLSLLAAGCLILSLSLRALAPDQGAVAELIAGLAALLVAVPAFVAAWQSLREPDLHGVTDQLIGLAVVASWAIGDLVTATLLPLVMTVGHVLEERSLMGSNEAIQALLCLTQVRARRVCTDGRIEEVAAQALEVGDLIEVRAGDHVAADGRVEVGASNVDNASITGESLPVERTVGDAVCSGAVNLDGVLRLRVTRVGEEATLGRVIALMQEAERVKPPITRLLEQYAGRYLVLVLLLAAAVWFVTHDAGVMLAVLVACCPCAIVLAAPATSVAAIAVASRHGILVKGAAFLEQLGDVDTLILDKTGTATLGELRLVAARPVADVSRPALLTMAASLGAFSAHPVSRALAALLPASERLPIEGVHEARGLGLLGQCAGDRVVMGRAGLFATLLIDAPSPPDHAGPVVGVARADRFLGWLLLADAVRPEARTTLADLRTLGIERQVLLTGDRADEAARIAAMIGLAEMHAEVLPAQKMRHVQDLLTAGRRPLVVGDGINDALALKAGAVGVAMGARGSDVALASADVVLLGNDLSRLGTCIRLSRASRRTIYVNVALGMAWTVVVIALAAFDVFGIGATLVAAIMHNVGALLVMGNAGRLLKFHEPGAQQAPPLAG